jgi:antitoxin PrlF
MATIVEETSTITAKGQTTIPKAVRQALGLSCGDKIAFRIEDGRVTVHSAETAHRDPVLVAYLRLIEKDVATGKVHDLPAGVGAAMRRAMKEIRVALDDSLEGKVDL